MTQMMKTGFVAATVVAVTLGAVACGRSEQVNQAPAASQAAAPAQAGAVEITFKTDPDPAKTGDNVFEVMVMQDGKPVSDAAVSAEFYMPAMPAMKMAEMRSKTDLSSAGDGVYRGNGQVMMAGNWEVTVMAMRNGQELASKKLTVTAK